MLVTSQLSRNKFLVIVVKITQKHISKFPGIVQFCLTCLLFLGIHCKIWVTVLKQESYLLQVKMDIIQELTMIKLLQHIIVRNVLFPSSISMTISSAWCESCWTIFSLEIKINGLPSDPFTLIMLQDFPLSTFLSVCCFNQSHDLFQW